jgi:Txe/YoeB family toxin of Txe-Axe toxin-antitoxin module
MQKSKYSGEKIRFTVHAAGYTDRRGFSLAEVEEAIKTEPWSVSEKSRLECKMNVPYGRDWNGKHYQTKQIRPIFVVENDEVVIITVYTYYF